MAATTSHHNRRISRLEDMQVFGDSLDAVQVHNRTDNNTGQAATDLASSLSMAGIPEQEEVLEAANAAEHNGDSEEAVVVEHNDAADDDYRG